MAKKPESTFINMVLRLLMVVSIAGVALGFVYVQTFDVIEAAKKAKLEAAIGKVVPEFDNLNSFKVMPESGKDSLTFYEASKDSEIVGTAVETYTDNGFSGRIKIMVGFDNDANIINTAVLEHKETPGLGDKMDISKSDWCTQFVGINPGNINIKVTKDGGKIDAITAATISSRAFIDAVDRAYVTFKNKGGNE